MSHRAKAVAKRRRLSLSAMVQGLLEREIGAGPKVAVKTVTFSERWGGRMKITDKNDERARRLKEKHGL